MENKCIKCGEIKPLSEFIKNRNECKSCYVETNVNRRRTKIGLISCIYDNQIRNSKDRGHSLPLYTRKELQDWMLNNSLFDRLYKTWVESCYDTNKKPSIDRIDDYKGYSFDNIQLMTWGENRAKSNAQHRKGESTIGQYNMPVIGTNLKNNEVVEFCSISQAGRELGIHKSRISDCCNNKIIIKPNGRLKHCLSAGGYKWTFKTTP